MARVRARLGLGLGARARAREGGVRIRNNSTNDTDCLEGLLPISEDWHAKVDFLEVIPNLILVLVDCN